MKRLIMLLIFMVAVPTVQAALISNMTFNTADGTYNNITAQDLAPASFDWNVTGATLQNGYLSEGYYFDGDDIINRSYKNMNFGNAFTIGFWFKHTNSGTMVEMNNQADANNLVRISFVANRVRVSINNQTNGATVGKAYYGATDTQTTQYYFFVTTWDGTDLKLYLDGVEDTPYTKSSDPFVSIINETRISYLGSQGVLDYYIGHLDEFFVYNTDLSASQISAMYNASEQNLGLYPCSDSIVTETLVINTRNVSNDNLLTSRIEAAFNYTINGTEQITGIEELTESLDICIAPHNATAVDTDYQVLYTFDDVSYTYFATGINLSNVSRTLNLYISDDTNQVLFNVKDNLGSNIEDAYITIDRYDIGSNTYRTSEVLKTDSAGNAVGNLKLNTAWYRITITYNGVVRLVDGPTLFTSNTKSYRISIEDDYFDTYSEYLGIQHNLTFNNATKNFRFVYVDTNQVSDEICLKVERLNITGNVLVNTTCSSSFSATLLAGIGPNINESRFLATAWVTLNNGTYMVLDVIEIDFLSDWVLFDKGGEGHGVFVAYLLTLTLYMIGLVISPVAAIALLTIGVIGSVLIGVYQMSLPIMITMIILSGVAIWRSGSK